NTTSVLISDAQTINSAQNVTGVSNNAGVGGIGTLHFTGSSIVSGSVGSSPLINDINAAGPGGSVVTFQHGPVFATTVHIASGALNFNDDAVTSSGGLVFTGDGFLTLAGGKSLTSAITVTSPNTGTLTLNALSQTVGAVGAGGSALKQLTLTGNSNITGALFVQNISLGSNA